VYRQSLRSPSSTVTINDEHTSQPLLPLRDLSAMEVSDSLEHREPRLNSWYVQRGLAKYNYVQIFSMMQNAF
jgi:hypothetical protein